MSSAASKPATATLKRPFAAKKEILVCLLFSIAFGIFVCTASNKFVKRDDRRSESVEMERSILRGQPFPHAGKMLYLPPWQNRVMFPAILEAGIHIGIFTPNGWYLLIRFISSVLTFAAFWFALRMDAAANLKLAGAGLLLLAYGLTLTFVSPIEMTSDLPEAMFTAIFITLALRRKYWVLLVLSIIAASNREASAFAGVIWFFLYGLDEKWKINWRESIFAGIISVFSYACAYGLRFIFGGTKAIKSNTQFLTYRGTFYNIKNFILHPTPFAWVGLLFCIGLPGVMLIIANRESMTLVQKRLLAAAGAIAAISIIFGNITEPRTFIMSIVILTFVAIWSEAVCKPAYAT
ncbi:MAG TPA: hypothetical protein VFC63_27590 [Blastocatellia bacterium]|nr:hypothetical protein [Blastocatellia bacterium]